MNKKYNDKLRSIVESKNLEWTNNIKDIMPLLRSQPENMVDANALALSYRTMLLEEMSYFTALMSNHEKDMRELKRDKFVFYATGTMPDGSKITGKAANNPMIGRKMTKSEHDIIISGDLSEQEHTLQIISDMVSQIKEYIKTIDQILYSIKNRLDLFNYLSGHK